MLGIVEYRPHIRMLHDAPRVHHRNAVAHLRHDAEVVRDEHNPHARIGLQVFEQPQILRLNGHIQRSGRLVRDKHFGVAGYANRAHDALPHPAAELMRVVADANLRRGNTHAPQHLHHLLAQRRALHPPVNLERLAHLVVYVKDGIERRHRVLQHHRNAVAANLFHLFLVQRQHIVVVEQHFAPDDVARRRGNQPHYGQRGNRLAGAGLAHDAQRFAAPQLKAHAVHRFHHAPARHEIGAKVLHIKDYIAYGAIRSSHLFSPVVCEVCFSVARAGAYYRAAKALAGLL